MSLVIPARLPNAMRSHRLRWPVLYMCTVNCTCVLWHSGSGVGPCPALVSCQELHENYPPLLREIFFTKYLHSRNSPLRHQSPPHDCRNHCLALKCFGHWWKDHKIINKNIVLQLFLENNSENFFFIFNFVYSMTVLHLFPRTVFFSLKYPNKISVSKKVIIGKHKHYNNQAGTSVWNCKKNF